jgi:hypothetical protein
MHMKPHAVRWRFYGLIGSTRMAESTLNNIRAAYGKDDPALTAAVADCLAKLDEVRKLLANHKDDWKVQK